MRITRIRDSLGGRDIYQLEITDADYDRCKLYPFDVTLLADCEKSGGVADKLLGLETIARRIEEETHARLGR